MAYDRSDSAVYADLHTHTLCSDGRLGPAGLVNAAADRGIRGLSVTDHDTLSGMSAAQEAAADRGVEFVTGIELSVTLGGDEVHLLAYGIDPSNEGLRSHLASMRRARRRRAWTMVEQLRARGLEIPDAALQTQLQGTTAPGRPHVAAALVKTGHVEGVREAFEKYLGENGPGFVEKPTVAVADVLTLVHEAGGVGVLAHPGHWTSSRQIRQLVESGLDGLEIYHPSHRSSLVGYYRRLANGHGLLVTGGSDYHGRTEADEQNLGAVGLSRGEWERFRADVA